jgi:hypothetical protein
LQKSISAFAKESIESDKVTFEELSKKYSNFFSPKCQITLNTQDLFQKYGAKPLAVTVEKTSNSLDKFFFTLSDPQLTLINGEVFNPGTKVEIKMGYATSLEMLTTGEIKLTKTSFQSNQAPNVEVSGENQTIQTSQSSNSVLEPVVSLQYGKALLSFKSEITAENQAIKTSPKELLLARQSLKKLLNVRCSGVCVGYLKSNPASL